MQKNIPKHVAIIMDGNRRWAKKENLLGFEGHRKGAKRAEEMAKAAYASRIPYITVWAASVDNLLKRKKTEVRFLAKLMEEKLLGIAERNKKENIRIRVIGESFEILKNKSLQSAIEKAENDTKKNCGTQFTILFGYDGKEEMIRAIKEIAENGESRISYESVKKNLRTAELPPVDLVIRTGGEPHWSSGFMMWHTADSEFYFTEILWPDFTEKEFKKALDEFSRRRRKRGK